MQLESTLFGVCVIQVKPQLERLLNLDPDSLTKEINLTQDIMNLIIDYQVRDGFPLSMMAKFSFHVPVSVYVGQLSSS